METRSCAEQGDPQTIDCYYQRITELGITTVRDAIPILPEIVRRRASLQETSRSRHQADTDHPRVILYEPGAEFLVSFSTLPSDPLYELIELIEFQGDSYKFAQIDMSKNPPEFSDDGKPCKACHGESLRPIWGGYPKWPGMIAPDRPYKEHLVRTLPDRFASLPVNGIWQGEFFNYHHARARNKQLTRLMKESPAYTAQVRYQLAEGMCKNPSIHVGKILQNLGFTLDMFRSDLLTAEAASESLSQYAYREFGYYFGNGMYERNLQNVAVMDLIFQDKDQELKAILQPFFDFLSQKWDHLNQETYDANNGYFPYPDFVNDRFVEDQIPYGGDSIGVGALNLPMIINLAGFETFWGDYPSYIGQELQQGNDVHQRFCAHVKSKL